MAFWCAFRCRRRFAAADGAGRTFLTGTTASTDGPGVSVATGIGDVLTLAPPFPPLVPAMTVVPTGGADTVLFLFLFVLL